MNESLELVEAVRRLRVALRNLNPTIGGAVVHLASVAADVGASAEVLDDAIAVADGAFVVYEVVLGELEDAAAAVAGALVRTPGLRNDQRAAFEGFVVAAREIAAERRAAMAGDGS